MLTNLTIINFKKFKKLKLNNLARINLLLGNNNSGKSTILEAIELSKNTEFDVRSFQKRNIQYIRDLYINIVKNKKGLLLEKLRIFDASIIEFELINDGFLVDVGLEKMLPINYLGTGIISIIYLIIYMLNSENGILLIDEIENGIYYKKIDKLIQVIDELSIELNVQLFITTHSEDFVSRLGGFSDFVVYRLNENKFEGGVLRHSRDEAIDSLSHADLR